MRIAGSTLRHRCLCLLSSVPRPPAPTPLQVIPNLGLAVTLYDILSIGDGHVYHSDGGAHYK